MAVQNVSEEFLSDEFRKIDFPLSIVNIVIGSITAVLGCISFLAITTDNRLYRKNAYILIDVLCVGYTLHGCGTLIKGAGDLLDHLNDVKSISKNRCFHKWITIAIGAEIVIDISFLTAVDRFIAIFKPLFYRNTNKLWWISGQLLLVAVHVSITTWREFMATSDETITICSIITAASEDVAVAMLIEFNTIVAVTVVIYIFLLIWVKYAIYKTKVHHGNEVEKRKQMKSKLMTTLALNVLVYLSTTFIGNLAYGTASKVEDKELAIVLVTFGEVSHFSSIFSILLLFFRMKEFRASVERLLRKDTSTTSAVSTTNTS